MYVSMSEGKKRVVVFAGNECVKEKEEYYYGIAYETGKLLARGGYLTVTGGGPGLMNEVSRGAQENGGKTLGICLEIPGRLHSNYLTKREIFHHLEPRQEKLLRLGDAYLALPGGIGTFYEIFEVIALKRKNEIRQNKPMILVNGFFGHLERLMEHIYKNGFATMDVKKLYTLVESPAQALEILYSHDI